MDGYLPITLDVGHLVVIVFVVTWRGVRGLNGQPHAAVDSLERRAWVGAEITPAIIAGPLFPLNSLMQHGIIYAQKAGGLSSDPGNDFRDEVISFFGSGTQIQEMYVTPSLLSVADWDVLAQAARWSRERAAILKDSHWVGGDPDQLQVYGWAAWNPQGWIVTLRDPSDRAQTFTLHLGAVLELPPGAATSFTVRQPFAAGAPPEHWEAAHAVTIRLQPFDVRIYERGK